jgi:hypothetical protein
LDALAAFDGLDALAALARLAALGALGWVKRSVLVLSVLVLSGGGKENHSAIQQNTDGKFLFGGCGGLLGGDKWRGMSSQPYREILTPAERAAVWQIIARSKPEDYDGHTEFERLSPSDRLDWLDAAVTFIEESQRSLRGGSSKRTNSG